MHNNSRYNEIRTGISCADFLLAIRICYHAQMQSLGSMKIGVGRQKFWLAKFQVAILIEMRYNLQIKV